MWPWKCLVWLYAPSTKASGWWSRGRGLSTRTQTAKLTIDQSVMPAQHTSNQNQRKRWHFYSTHKLACSKYNKTDLEGEVEGKSSSSSSSSSASHGSSANLVWMSSHIDGKIWQLKSNRMQKDRTQGGRQRKQLTYNWRRSWILLVFCMVFSSLDFATVSGQSELMHDWWLLTYAMRKIDDYWRT